MSSRGTCWEGYVQKGMKKKGNRMVPNCVPAGGMKEGGLKKWFNEKKCCDSNIQPQYGYSSFK